MNPGWTAQVFYIKRVQIQVLSLSLGMTIQNYLFLWRIFLTCRIDLSLLWDCLYLLVRTTVNHLNILLDTIITVASLLTRSISLHPQIHASWLQINRKRGGFCNVFITLLIISRLNYIMSYSIHLIYLYDFLYFISHWKACRTCYLYH